jgi:hypothetical protein
MPRKKIRNQNNEDQIEKLNTINLHLMIKLKTNKTFTKRPRKKIKKIKRIRTNVKKKTISVMELIDEIENK